MSVELMFSTHNRLAFAEASLEALLENTNFELVNRVHLLDDNSKDGTHALMSEVGRMIPTASRFTSAPFGGPVAAMNDALDHCDSELLAKIDSDTIVCPGWLDIMLDTLNAHPQIDALGMEPGFASFVAPLDVPRTAKPARWIGGVGLFRTRVFGKRRPVQHERFWGWTQFQRQYCKSAWITPDLPCFLLDHLEVEPWRSLTRRYIELGWQREVVGAPYTSEQVDAYAGWWLASQAGRKMETAAQ